MYEHYQKTVLEFIYFFKNTKNAFTDAGQTKNFVKIVLSHLESLKTLKDRNPECHFSHKTNTFSYDENLKRRIYLLNEIRN